ncbi:MAG: hypothetical protein IJN54_11535 [Lachnospiraceae bacterium]|nr:hypothetical protein [Lachnospiraceae bacterium]
MRKRINIVIPIIICMFILFSCENDIKENNGTSGEQIISTEEIAKTKAGQKNCLQDIENTKQNVTYEISDAEVTIGYEGEPFTKSVFKTGGEMVYIHGIKEDGSYFLGNMKKEEKILKELSIEVPENMRIINMAVDFYEDCHILWTSVDEIELDGHKVSQMTFEKSLITKVNKEGNTEFTVDISEIIKEKVIRPFCFNIDKDGNYYLENNSDIYEIIKIDSNGNTSFCFSCEGNIEVIGNGKSGAVYCIYTNEKGEELLGKLQENEIVFCDVILPEANAKYSEICRGTDTELILYNKENGVYIYDLNRESVEQRKKGNDLPVYGEEVSGYGVLGDGRLCLMTQNKTGTFFYYIPIGK